MLYAINGTYKALGVWLAVRGDTPGALFVAIGKGGKISAKGMTTTTVHGVLGKSAANV